MAKLVIKTPGMSAEALPLKPGRNRLGRSSENDFMIQHDTVSRFHCEVEVLEDSMTVRDLDSSNGTFVDDEPVEKPMPLTTGQILAVGDVRLEVKDAPQAIDPDALVMCANHPTYPASMECTQCHRVFCGPCIHILKRLGGKILRLCPACSGHCEPLKNLTDAKRGLIGNLMKKIFKR